MNLVPRREHLILLAGDVCVFVLALWLTLAARYLALPSGETLALHFGPFAFLFILWIFVFFLAGLYGRHTRLLRSRLLPTILSVQIINVVLAALFFFTVPHFGITPKTILAIYLIISSVLIVLWRLGMFARFRLGRRLKGILIAAGPDAKMLADEIASDARYPFHFEYVVDTSSAPTHEIVQHACRVAEEDDIEFLVVDVSDAAVQAALPILYDAAFQKRRFVLLNLIDVYQEVFDRIPLSLVKYEWVLANSNTHYAYDALKRVIDIIAALAIGVLSLLLYPFIILAIKLDDGGEIFIRQERVGKFQKPMYIYKFRTMNGNDGGKYGSDGRSALRITRVGKYLRVLRLDELPQLANVLLGDLSIVGPRPEFPSLAEHYNARIPYYNARYLMRPGLTGWAQILHDRHPHHGTDVVATKEKLSYDLYYYLHRSFLLDLYVIFQTVRIVITARGS